MRVKYVLEEKTSVSAPELPCGAISFGRVVQKNGDRILDETRATYQEVRAGEFLVNPINLNYDLKSLRTALSQIDVCVSPAYIVLRRVDDSDPGFIRYLLHQFDIAHMKSLGAGVRQTITFEDIGNCFWFLPPVQEQAAISAFLDRETDLIDALIEKKTRFIELLREKRQALITQAVTRGLDSGVPTKDSGIDWLGAIPAHWDARLIRHVSQLESGHTPDKQTDAYWLDCKIQWVSLSDSDALRTNDYIYSTAKQINELGLANSSARLLPAGTVVMTRDATVGLCSVLGGTMAVSQHLVAWVPGEQIDSRYLLYAIRAMGPWLHGLTTGATIRTIGMDHIRALVVPLPPVQEQRDIARYIVTRSERMDALIDATECSIDLLRERRAALIAAAVTGQIDVREAA